MKKRRSKRRFFIWSGCRESNSVFTHPKRAYYRYTTPRVEEEYHELANVFSPKREGASYLLTPHIFDAMTVRVSRTIQDLASLTCRSHLSPRRHSARRDLASLFGVRQTALRLSSPVVRHAGVELIVHYGTSACRGFLVDDTGLEPVTPPV